MPAPYAKCSFYRLTLEKSHTSTRSGRGTVGNSEMDRPYPLRSSSATQLLEKSRLARSILGIEKIAQPDANQAKALVWTHLYALAQRQRDID